MEQVELYHVTVDFNHRTEQDHNIINNTSHLTNQAIYAATNASNWHALSFQQQQPHHHYKANNMQLQNYPYGTQTQKLWCKQGQDSDDHSTYTTATDVYQLQLGNNNNNTHNFFGLQNIMSMDSASMDNNSGTNYVIYGAVRHGIVYVWDIRCGRASTTFL